MEFSHEAVRQPGRKYRYFIVPDSEPSAEFGPHANAQGRQSAAPNHISDQLCQGISEPPLFCHKTEVRSHFPCQNIIAAIAEEDYTRFSRSLPVEMQIKCAKRIGQWLGKECWVTLKFLKRH